MKHNPGNKMVDRPCHQTCRWTQSILQITPAISRGNTQITPANHAKFNFCIILKWLECEHIYSRSSAIKHQRTRNRTFATNEIACIPHLLAKSSHSLICSFTLVGLCFFGLLCEEIDPLNVSRIRKGKACMHATWLTGKAIQGLLYIIKYMVTIQSYFLATQFLFVV